MHPQTMKVLRHLRDNGSITPMEAHIVHNVRSLSSRMSEIAKAGYPVLKEFHKDATGQRYVKYIRGFAPKFEPLTRSQTGLSPTRKLRVGDRIRIKAGVRTLWYIAGNVGTVAKTEYNDGTDEPIMVRFDTDQLGVSPSGFDDEPKWWVQSGQVERI